MNKTAGEIAAALQGFRFHDLRHQAITELAEAGAPDRVIEALAGHLSRKMLEHYSHIRKMAKLEAINKLPGGLMPALSKVSPAEIGSKAQPVTSQPASQDGLCRDTNDLQPVENIGRGGAI
jgi:hypothetical protein